MRQKDLASILSITTASASTLVDRLVRDGYAVRVAHPDDRRSVAVQTTAHSDKEVRDTLGAMHAKMLAAVESYPPEGLAVIADFLGALTEIIRTDHGSHDPGTEHPTTS
ncbi:MarR family winged helix-turn-helix transcriptional regulator [Litorihabitans aurantiacus]|uniref:HTH marR-type domain-containing protein n=1 Tax=Litorihabitans aurantiacus TaxID=1930061 RepID=A0AA37XFB3_9MICO|nr:hypothetical protein GCM10025875_20920 [Litorihabitans aurantiacus]